MNKTRLKYQFDTGIRAESLSNEIQQTKYNYGFLYDYIHWLEEQIPGPIIKTHVLDEKK